MSVLDLHTHSTCSDGTLSPEALIAEAARERVDTIALTDHDTVAGLAAAAHAANSVEVNFIPGIEISVTWNGKVVHIVGLHIDRDDPVLQHGLERLAQARRARAEEIGRRLRNAGADVMQEAHRQAGGGMITRTHYARALTRAGHAGNESSAFKRYLAPGRPGYVMGAWATLTEAVGWIRGAGGVAVVAHPLRYRMSRTQLNRLLEEFTAAGGEGIEVITTNATPNRIRDVAQLANRYALAGSVGSDYHGPETAWNRLGHLAPLPQSIRPVWDIWH